MARKKFLPYFGWYFLVIFQGLLEEFSAAEKTKYQTDIKNTNYGSKDQTKNYGNKDKKESSSSEYVIYIVVIIVTCLCVLGLAVAGYLWHRHRSQRKKSSTTRSIRYHKKTKSADQTRDQTSSQVDNDLDKKAEVYHYQQTKKKINEFLNNSSSSGIFFEPQGDDKLPLLYDGETSDGDASVYGCIGIAAVVGESTEIHNPLFDDVMQPHVDGTFAPTPKAQVLRDYSHTNVTAYGSIRRTLPDEN